MNKKGFTLVEMLAVIVILGIVGTIAIYSITGAKRTADRGMLADKLQLASDTAVKYYEQNKVLKRKLNDGKEKIKVEDLIANKYFSTEEQDTAGNKALINPITNESMNSLEICVYKSYQRVYACIPLNLNNKGLVEDLFPDGYNNPPAVEANVFCEKSDFCG